MISRLVHDTQTKLAQLTPIGINSRQEMSSPSTGEPGTASQKQIVAWNDNNAMGIGAFILAWLLLAAAACRWILRHHRAAGSQLADQRTIPPAVLPSSPTARTLTVLFSDMKDYTARAAAESNQGVIELVRRHRDMAQPIVRTHGGRIVKTMGDALLVVFESATSAVRAAVELQQAVRRHNAQAFTDRERFEIRIAICTGEVVVDAGDVFGDTVNLASRVQQLAGPGEVLFADSTRATIKQAEIACESAGEFELKGIPGKVRLFRAHVEMAPSVTGSTPSRA